MLKWNLADDVRNLIIFMPGSIGGRDGATGEHLPPPPPKKKKKKKKIIIIRKIK